MFSPLSPTSDNVSYVRLEPCLSPVITSPSYCHSQQRPSDAQACDDAGPQPEASATTTAVETAEVCCERLERDTDFSFECQHFWKKFSPTPEPCNTGVSIRHEGLESGGLDTIEVSLYGGWNLSRFDDLKRQLDQAKAKAEAGMVEAAYVRSDDGDRLEVEAYGVRKGVGCRWVVNWNGCRIAIVNNHMPSDVRLSLHVTIGSVRLMEVGHVVAWESLLAMLASFGYEHIREVVGRADLCTDHVDRSMQEVESAINEKRLICRARKAKRYETSEQLETYVRGSGPLLVRIYDKAIECRNDPVKQALLIEKRWGCGTSSAVRVEFQLRRKALQRFFSIRSMDQLFQALGTVASWCNSEWFRIVETFDRKNRNHARAETSEFWREVQRCFETWTGTPLPRTPGRRRIRPEFKRLKQQAAGCIAAVIAHVDNGKDLFEFSQLFDELVVMANIKEKRRRLAAAGRVLVIPDAEIPF